MVGPFSPIFPFCGRAGEIYQNQNENNLWDIVYRYSVGLFMGILGVFEHFHKEEVVLASVLRITLLLELKIPRSIVVQDAIEAEKYIFWQSFQLWEKSTDNRSLTAAQ